MKVLLVWNGPANRMERSILARREVFLLEQLRARGVDVCVALCGDDAGLHEDLVRIGVTAEVVPVSLPPSAVALFRLPSAARRLRRVIARLRPDLIEASEAMPAIATGLAARRSGRMVLYRRQHGGGRKRLLFASRLAARLADRTIVSCEAMRALSARDDRSRPDRIEVAMPGTAEPPRFDRNDLTAARMSIGLSDESRVIAVVSRFRHEKGLDVLIRALDHLRHVEDLHLVIAGNGPEESYLRGLAARSRVPVHFLGSREDIALWLQVADVVAIPSRRESFGRVILEAMANGCAIVATAAGGMPEAIVDGESGLIVPPAAERALADALEAVLSDRVFARRLGDAARERFRSRYTIAHMAAQRLAAWQRSLEAGGRA